jgi:hypothetical protein
MKIKTILSAAVAAVAMSMASVAAADAASYHGGFGYHPVVRHEVRRVVDHRVVFESLRARHIRFTGEPYFVRSHYVVRSFVEVNPHTGRVIGFIRL